MDRRLTWPGRLAARLRPVRQRIASMPRSARLVVIALVVVAGFVSVVLPLFSTSGAPMAEIAGALPTTAGAGRQVTVDVAIDNVGDSIIDPLCVSLTGTGASLVSADFQGLDRVTATANRVCGGQLTGQETISVSVVLRFGSRGTSTVTLTPEQGSTVIGPILTGSVAVS